MWLFELVVGMVDKGEENLVEVVKCEVFEEVGIEVKEVEYVLSVWDSLGG